VAAWPFSLPAAATGSDVASGGEEPGAAWIDASHYPPGSYRPGEISVSLEDCTAGGLDRLLEEYSSIFETGAGEVISASRDGLTDHAIRLRLRPGMDELEAARLLTVSPLVRTAEPNVIFHAATDPNDTLYVNGQQYNLNGAYGVKANQAWDLQKGSSGLTIAVIDTGMDYNHEDLAGRRSGGYDFFNNDGDPWDDNGHGTMVCGVACANTNNARGVAGVDWSARIMPLKALGKSGEGSLDGVVNSIYYAANNGASVINMSFTSPTYSRQLQEAVEYAHSRGCIMVAAVGNEGDSRLNYPAALTYVIGVGSVDENGLRSSFSNVNSTVDLVAPGKRIYGPYIGPGGIQYAWGSGTSEAAPQVSGAALLVLAEYPGSTPQEVWRRLADGARDLGGAGYDEEYGWGLLDINASLRVPLVTVISPQEYSYPSSGKVSAVAGSANASVKNMELWLDGDLLESGDIPVPSGSVNYTFGSWDLGQLPEGTHTLTVKAIDVSGQWEGEHAVTVYRNLSQPKPSTHWYLAEGTTAWGFEEYVLVQNPNPAGASVHATFMKPGGDTQEFDFFMPANSRLTIPVNNLVPSSDVSTHIHADQAVVAERAMYWGGRDGGHATLGVTGGCATWYLAEGTTAWGFEEYVLVQNPNPATVSVTFSFLKPEGSQVRVTYGVAPHSRFTVNAANVVPGSDVSTLVQASGPVIAERAMYWPKGSRSRAEGHCSTGSVTAARTWYLAEGSTAWGFDEYVLLVNPTDDIAHAVLSFMRTDGSLQGYVVSIAGGARMTVHANEVDPGRDASVRVTCDLPLVVERAMYWSEKEGGTDALGVLQP
jgi:thermitase